MNIDTLLDAMQKPEKKLEVAFIAVFSALILIIFYVVISMNGVVLGNDPAVHLEKAQIFLRTGEISLANLGWTPPLYQIVLAMLISLSAAAEIGQYIFVVRLLTVVVDWLLFMSVYLIASKFFSKKVGAVAAVLLLMCFPVFEANQFGGYTTVLALAFMLLVLLYTPLAMDKLGYLVVAFFAAFGLVLSHQLAAFLAVFILPPALLFMLIKSKGKNLKVVLALVLGGGIAFFLYYFQAMFGYIDLVIEYVFFAIKSYAYQIPAVSFSSFMTNFGFILFLGLTGVGVSFYVLRKQKKPLYWLILVLSLFVPFFFAQSYLIGFYMPFAWFIYYITTPLAILAAVTVVFLAEKIHVLYVKHHYRVFAKKWVKVLSIILIVALSAVVLVRSDTVYARIMEASVYYSTTDLKALDAGVWLKTNYPDAVNVVTTAVPGFWFQEFSDKNVTAQTELAVQRMEMAEAVLTLAYEFEHSQTMLKAYQAKGDILDENYVSMDQIWSRVSFSSASGDCVYYTLNGVDHEVKLSQLSKEVEFEEGTVPKVTFVFSNDDIVLTKTVSAQNNRYPFTVSWTLTPLKSEIYNASIYLTTNFDLKYHFEEVEIPGLMDWISPWDAPEQLRTTEENNLWTAASFVAGHLKDSYLGLYDESYGVGFAFRFSNLPDWGNIGALGNRQIDAVRLVYNFNDVAMDETVSCSYQILALSKNSYPILSPQMLNGLFDLSVEGLPVTSRDFRYYIEENDIGFIVYDRNQLDTQMINSKLLQLIYSNDRYVIFKILR